MNGCGTATIELDDGSGVRQVEVELPNRPGAPRLSDGDDVVVLGSEADGSQVLTIVDHQRAGGLWVLALAFVLALAAFGRWRGLTALAGLAVTFVVLLLFVVPAILDGRSPSWSPWSGRPRSRCRCSTSPTAWRPRRRSPSSAP